MCGGSLAQERDLSRLLLVRHGTTDFNTGRRFMGQSDIELSDEGYRQAEKLRDYLAREKIDAAYSSDLRRALVTAEVICQERGLEIVTCPELRECDYGECEGLTFGEIGSSYPEVAARCINFTLDLEFPGGECYRDFFERTGRFLERLDSYKPEKTVLVVAHDGVLKALLCTMLGIDGSHWWQLRLDTASLSIMETHPRGARLTRLNDVCHLAADTD